MKSYKDEVGGDDEVQETVNQIHDAVKSLQESGSQSPHRQINLEEDEDSTHKAVDTKHAERSNQSFFALLGTFNPDYSIFVGFRFVIVNFDIVQLKIVNHDFQTSRLKDEKWQDNMRENHFVFPIQKLRDDDD